MPEHPAPARPRWRVILLANALLLLLGTIAGLALCEIALRIMINHPSDLYANLPYAPERNSRYHALVFLEQHRGDASAPISQDIAYDSILGWDSDTTGDHIRGDATYPQTPPPGKTRIVAVGDSFTYGTDVPEEDSYPHYLGDLLGAEVLNMGVGGYGIDQAVLKYLHYGRSFKPSLLILGIHPPNWERCTLSFNAYLKPRFVYDPATNQVTLTNTTIPPVAETLKTLPHTARPWTYLIPFVEQRYLQYEWRTHIASQEPYWRDSTMAVHYLFTQLLTALKADDVRLLVVQIPHGEHFSSDQFLHNYQTANMEVMYLRGLYEAFRMPYLDLAMELPKRYSREEIYNDFYLIRENGQRGHFTPKGNRAVAELIRDKISAFPLDGYACHVPIEWDESIWRR